MNETNERVMQYLILQNAMRNIANICKKISNYHRPNKIFIIVFN